MNSFDNDPNVIRIKELALSQFVMDVRSIHGVEHWEHVKENGRMLSLQPGVDPLVVELFSYLHDCKRIDDHIDPEHGDRSAEFCTELRSSGDLDFLDGHQFTMLWTACKLHHTGSVTANPTIGVCFDADRIELIRCGITPRHELMNTLIGKRFAEKLEFHRYIKTL
jgi:uncharacterized protein